MLKGTVHLREMIENSFAWAATRGKLRKNKVHGFEEAKLVLEDWFAKADEKGTEHTMQGSADIEDPFPKLWNRVLTLNPLIYLAQCLKQDADGALISSDESEPSPEITPEAAQEAAKAAALRDASSKAKSKLHVDQ